MVCSCTREGEGASKGEGGEEVTMLFSPALEESMLVCRPAPGELAKAFMKSLHPLRMSFPLLPGDSIRETGNHRHMGV